MPLDQVHDDFGVGFGAERVTLGFERRLELTVVLDDAVQRDREPALVALGQRVRILLADGAVCRPACVPEPVVRDRAVRTGDPLQVLEVSDRTDVIEAVVLMQRDAGGVVAPVLEPLEALQQQVLRSAVADVSDDPAHPKLLSVAAPSSEWIKIRFAVFRFDSAENAKARLMRPLPAVEAVSRALVAREP